jgi:hypothetical protein
MFSTGSQMKIVDDMVYYGQDRSVPRDLYDRSSRLLKNSSSWDEESDSLTSAIGWSM